MPNWCNVTYAVTGNSDSVKKLYRIVKDLSKRKTPLVPNDFGLLWLGCVITKLGGNWKDIYCRGDILNFEYDKKQQVLFLYIDAAWSEPQEFRVFLQSVLSGLYIYYVAEESGMEIYETNDREGKYFSSKYLVESDDESMYFDTFEKLQEYLESIFGTKPHNYMEVETLVDQYNEDEGYLNLHKFKIV